MEAGQLAFIFRIWRSPHQLDDLGSWKLVISAFRRYVDVVYTAKLKQAQLGERPTDP